MADKNMPEDYDSSIRSLKGAERVRLRPGVMFGSDDINGAFHTLKEILGNSLDEVLAGYGDTITVVYHEDGSISVEDQGRGVPMGWNEQEKRFNWDLIFNELYAGGKYDDGDLDKISIGLNGLGAAATQYASEWMEVISYRSDGISRKNFKRGAPTDEELVTEPNTTGKTGTYIRWKVDNEVFPDTDFTTRMFTLLLESQAHLNEIKLVFSNEKTDQHFEFIGEGIESYLLSQIEGGIIDTLKRQETSNGAEHGKQYKVRADVVLAITEDTISRQMHFHNTGEMRSGTHYQAFDDAVTEFFKEIAKDHGVKIVPYDYSGYLSVITSTYSNITSFANQTKDGVSNLFVYNILRKTFLDILEEAKAMQKESMQTLIDNVVTAAFARKKAKEIEAQERLINRVTGQRRKKPEKYVPCREKDPAICELFIVEGDSASSSCEDARDGRFQALLPLKGKPMNGLKASIEDLLSNEEVQGLINTIGTGVDVDGTDLFDITKCNFDKIIITTDADVDGNQIRVLVYTIFYRLMPQLLEAGKIFVAETPLFELVTSQKGKDVSLFAYTSTEYDEIIEDCKSKGIHVKKINRSKGLGQNNPDMLRLTTMAPESRRLIPLTLDVNDNFVRAVSTMLFGDDPGKERKGFIFSLLEDKLGNDPSLVDIVDTITALESEDEPTEELA